MQDKSFQQAMQELQDRISGDLQESVRTMLLHGTTATSATLNIKDETIRAVVTDAIIINQIIALLTLMKDLSLLDEAQHKELTTYLGRSLHSKI